MEELNMKNIRYDFLALATSQEIGKFSRELTLQQ